MTGLIIVAVALMVGWFFGARVGRNGGLEDGAKAGLEQAQRILARAQEFRFSPTVQHAVIRIAGNYTDEEMVAALKALVKPELCSLVVDGITCKRSKGHEHPHSAIPDDDVDS